jgi:hypothetical protein
MQIKTMVFCDFCGGGMDHSEENVIKTREHEIVCHFNPANRTCVTCENYVYDCIGSEYCRIHVKEFFDISDDGLSCDRWIKEE